MESNKAKLKKLSVVLVGLCGAAVAGFAEGAAIDRVVADQISRAIEKGDLPTFIATLGVAFLIWFELRGMKKSIIAMNQTVTAGFTAGELRFENIEKTQNNFEHRLTMLEQR